MFASVCKCPDHEDPCPEAHCKSAGAHRQLCTSIMKMLLRLPSRSFCVAPSLNRWQIIHGEVQPGTAGSGSQEKCKAQPSSNRGDHRHQHSAWPDPHSSATRHFQAHQLADPFDKIEQPAECEEQAADLRIEAECNFCNFRMRNTERWVGMVNICWL